MLHLLQQAFGDDLHPQLCGRVATKLLAAETAKQAVILFSDNGAFTRHFHRMLQINALVLLTDNIGKFQISIIRLEC